MDHAELARVVYAARELANVHDIARQQKHHAAVGFQRKRELFLVSGGGDYWVVLELLLQQRGG
ncbi:hypothetical protein SDC9_192959 [bioreactor metagenome]|uniref:Uncharacterized protein n=1 Tax=bioreactor metagenome TaxID=1076179 RepID=A0A645I3P4_9ZZZZ